MKNIKIIERKNGGITATRYGNYTYWIYQKEKTFDTQTYINANDSLDKKLIYKLIGEVKKLNFGELDLLDWVFRYIDVYFMHHDQTNYNRIIKDNEHLEAIITWHEQKRLRFLEIYLEHLEDIEEV